jgi:hypothetical protein
MFRRQIPIAQILAYSGAYLTPSESYCSRDIYLSLPTLSLYVHSSEVARPKSLSFITPDLVRNMFSGLISQ